MSYNKIPYYTSQCNSIQNDTTVLYLILNNIIPHKTILYQKKTSTQNKIKYQTISYHTLQYGNIPVKVYPKKTILYQTISYNTIRYYTKHFHTI